MGLPYATDGTVVRLAKEVAKEEVNKALAEFDPGQGGGSVSGVENVYVDGQSVVSNNKAYITQAVKKYNNTYPYAIGDLVESNGNIFRSTINDNLGHDPMTLTPYWVQYNIYNLIRHVEVLPEEDVDIYSDSFIEVDGEVYFKWAEQYKGRIRYTYKKIGASESVDGIIHNSIQIENDNGSIALGGTTISEGETSVYIGNSIEAAGDNSVAIGAHAQLSDDYATSVGAYSTSTGNGTAIGANSVSSSGGTALGKGAKALATNAIQLGAGENTTSNSLQVGSDTIYKTDDHALMANGIMQAGKPIWGTILDPSDPDEYTEGNPGQLYLNISTNELFFYSIDG